ncbi:MAG: 30S ribosomal protein S7 [Actinobacteria bacterium]|nr:30S ribosomal protein S7 [Actinomycetota bacterium]
MPRKGYVEQREVPPDPIHDSPLVTKFINSMMWDGKKSTAQTIFYGALDLVGQRANDEPLKVFKRAIENIKPVVEVKSRRVGGANYQVPVEVNNTRRVSLAVRWLIAYSRSRSEKGMTQRLAAEILEAANNRGGAVKKREDVHRMAEANKAFAHYRW